MNWEKTGINCIKEAFRALKDVKTAEAMDNSLNPHTDADLISHNAILKVLHDSGASCQLVSEESAERIIIGRGGDEIVVADPIDNTVFFSRGLMTTCAVSLFVIKGGEPVYSFVGDLATGNIYHSDPFEAFKNQKQIIAPKSTIGRPILSGWAPYAPRMEKFYENFCKLPQKEFLVFNSASILEHAMICDGYFDAGFHVTPTKLQEFAGAIIAWRAGGEISTMEGKPIVWDANVLQTMLVSRNKELHQKLLAAFNSN